MCRSFMEKQFGANFQKALKAIKVSEGCSSCISKYNKSDNVI